MARARHPGQEALHQLPHQVGRSAQLQRRHIRLRLPLREHVDQKRQRERVAVRELEHPPVLLLRDTRATQKRPRVVRPEVAQRDHAQQVAPPRIPPPRRPPGRSSPPRRRAHTPAAPGRTAPAANPRARPQPRTCPAAARRARGRRTPRAGRLGGQPDRAPELGHERRRRRLDRAQIEAHDADAGVRGRLGERAQQRGLPDPAGTVDPQHAERRFRRRERPAEQLELRRTPDEPPPPRTLQAVGDRRRRRRLVRVWPRDREASSVHGRLTPIPRPRRCYAG